MPGEERSEDDDAAGEPLRRRTAKKERTRRQLIEAAADVIAERGFHSASLMDVASRAGLTTGAVYSNFRSKEDLFLAVIEEMAMPMELGPESSATWERLRQAALRAARRVDRPESRRLVKLQLEFALLTLTDPVLSREFVADLRRDQDDLAGVLAQDASAPAPSFQPSTEQLATAIIASLQGMLQHRFMDPDSVPDESAAWVVQALLHVAGDGRPVGASEDAR